MTYASPSTGTVLERAKEKVKDPEARVIVLDDSVNTFEHVVNCLRKIIPRMTQEKAWNLTRKVDKEGSAVVWSGPLEQAELYHQQLVAEGLTMAPLERF